MARFGTVFFTGFFDRLHTGHKDALRFVNGLDCDRIVVLVAPDSRITERRKELGHLIQPEAARLENVRAALRELGMVERAEARVERYSAWPPELVFEARPEDAFVFNMVENPGLGDAINSARMSRGLAPVTMIHAGQGRVASSTRLRRALSNVMAGKVIPLLERRLDELRMESEEQGKPANGE